MVEGASGKKKKLLASKQRSEAGSRLSSEPVAILGANFFQETVEKKTQLAHSKIERGGNKRRAVRNPQGGEFKGLRSQTRPRRACVDSSGVSNSACTAVKNRPRQRPFPAAEKTRLFAHIRLEVCSDRSRPMLGA